MFYDFPHPRNSSPGAARREVERRGRWESKLNLFQKCPVHEITLQYDIHKIKDNCFWSWWRILLLWTWSCMGGGNSLSNNSLSVTVMPQHLFFKWGWGPPVMFVKWGSLGTTRYSKSESLQLDPEVKKLNYSILIWSGCHTGVCFPLQFKWNDVRPQFPHLPAYEQE